MNGSRLSAIFMAVALAPVALAPAALLAQSVPVPSKPPANRLAPYVPSPQNVVVRMLQAAQVKPGDIVYDLGSGDGRVLITAAQRFGARAVGVEISPKEVKTSLDRIKSLKLEDKVRVIEGDLLKVDLSEADVVTIYLLTKSNEMLRPNLEKYLKPGARVVSHDYEIRGWVANRIEEAEAYKRVHRLFVYEMPPTLSKK